MICPAVSSLNRLYQKAEQLSGEMKAVREISLFVINLAQVRGDSLRPPSPAAGVRSSWLSAFTGLVKVPLVPRQVRSLGNVLLTWAWLSWTGSALIASTPPTAHLALVWRCLGCRHPAGPAFCSALYPRPRILTSINLPYPEVDESGVSMAEAILEDYCSLPTIFPRLSHERK